MHLRGYTKVVDLGSVCTTQLLTIASATLSCLFARVNYCYETQKGVSQKLIFILLWNVEGKLKPGRIK